ncbi:MAG: hypothetical protein ACLTTU_06745 [Bilophila wadsworthia]
MKDHHILRPDRLQRGWHFFVAIMVIIVIMAFGYSPGMSALGGIITLIVIHSIKSRKVDFKMLYEAMVLGGRYRSASAASWVASASSSRSSA